MFESCVLEQTQPMAASNVQLSTVLFRYGLYGCIVLLHEEDEKTAAERKQAAEQKRQEEEKEKEEKKGPADDEFQAAVHALRCGFNWTDGTLLTEEIFTFPRPADPSSPDSMFNWR